LRDRSSHTPCEFILPEFYNAPKVDSLPHRTGRLIIGDEALRLSNGENAVTNYTDLGELWREKTGHPVTFARWMTRSGDIAAELAPILIEARDWSMVHMSTFIDNLHEKYGFPPDLIDKYLRINMCYMHGPREQAGDRLFNTLAKNLLSRKEIG
jgi:chorismate dehydratase